MAQAVRKAFAADADSYDRALRKLVPCFDDFYRTALELLPVCGELLILGKLVIRHTQVEVDDSAGDDDVVSGQRIPRGTRAHSRDRAAPAEGGSRVQNSGPASRRQRAVRAAAIEPRTGSRSTGLNTNASASPARPI